MFESQHQTRELPKYLQMAQKRTMEWEQHTVSTATKSLSTNVQANFTKPTQFFKLNCQLSRMQKIISITIKLRSTSIIKHASMQFVIRSPTYKYPVKSLATTLTAPTYKSPG
ncbi:hypothetical protein AVEN_226034-1 [Araneus ventricosus]|uniref:Uncharacterized protein n=1 Tax=Araneus ventricosus TaxID=182803 RepID=A0A4Y2IK87_ARAVE|nr:hypothetical protein AVEN_226034-1 [Araneus ventricosus]